MHVHKQGMTIPNANGSTFRSQNLVINGDDGVVISVSFDNAHGHFEHLARCSILVWDKDKKDLEQKFEATALDLAQLILKYCQG